MQANRNLPSDVEHLLRPRDPTLIWRILFGVVTVIAVVSILGNILLGMLQIDYSKNRETRIEAVTAAEVSKKAQSAAEAALAGRDSKINELSAKTQELEFAIVACRNDKEQAERQLASAKAGTAGLPTLGMNRILQRVSSLRFQASISSSATSAGVRDGAVLLQAQSVARGMGVQADDSAQAAVVIQVSGIDQGKQGSCWVVEAALTEPWRVPGKEASYRVILCREAQILSTAKQQGVEADVLSVVDEVTKALLERIAKAKSEK